MSCYRYWDREVTDVECTSIEQAVESARDWFRGNPARLACEIEEFREPNLTDFPDFSDYGAEEALDCIRDSMRVDVFPPVPMNIVLDSPEYAALRDALRAYIAAHTDLSKVAWKPTGRKLRVYRDGTHEIIGDTA